MNSVFYEQRSENPFTGSICDHPFPSHVHDVAEIVCLLTGMLEMTVAGHRMTVRPGDVVVIFPHVPHSYDVVTEDATGLAMIFSPETIGEFAHAFRTMQPISPLLSRRERPPELGGIIRSIVKLSAEESSPLKLGYVHLFLSYLFTAVKLLPREKNAHTGLCYQVLQYISEHFAEPLSLETTAHALGISRIHLSHIFSQQLRINFRQYINTLRIDRACILLRNPNYSISQIAYQCGYGNPRTFHRAFLAQCGMPPNRYRARLSGREDDDGEDTAEE